MSRKRKLPSTEPVWAKIEALDQEGRGVARVRGKVVFVDGALAGEEVMFRYRRTRGRYDEGVAVHVLKAAPERVEARCPHFGVCGGCSMQHLSHDAQLKAKQEGLVNSLKHIGKVEPEEILGPLTTHPWGYRRKARLGVRYVPKKGGALVGFRERHSNRVAELSRCEVLDPSVGLRIEALRELVSALDARERIPQIEVAVGEGVWPETQTSPVTETALVFRHLGSLGAGDLGALRTFAQAQGVCVFLQPRGPDTVRPLWPTNGDDAVALSYRLPDYDLALAYGPTDFIQINAGINRVLVSQALELLAPGRHERVLDLFCGLGNFTLPLARYAAHGVGLEGDATLVKRAQANAHRNGVENVEFHTADLMDPMARASWVQSPWDKLLLDPPRGGALEVIEALSPPYPSRVVYVSCNPATLARDAGVLVNQHGFRLLKAGIVDMFPHTSHVESIGLFALG